MAQAGTSRLRVGLGGLKTTGLIVLPLAAAAIVGFALGTGQSLIAILLLVAIFSGIACVDMTLSSWAASLIVTTVVIRAVTYLLGLSQALNFVHYLLCVVFAVAALIRPHQSSRENGKVGRWIFGFVLLTALSMFMNATEPMRVLIFLAIFLEPVVIIWAIVRWPVGDEAERRILSFAALVMVVQIPFGIWQAVNYGIWDPVVGTLIGHGAGAHVLGALFALMVLCAAAAVSAKRVTFRNGVLTALLGVGMIILAGAFQVLVALVGALGVSLFLTRSSGRSKEHAPRAGTARLALVVGLIVLIPLFFAGTFVSTFAFRVKRIVAAQEWPELEYLGDRVHDPAALLVGSGPGTTASRASLLLTPVMLKEGGPLSSLHLTPTKEGLHFAAAQRIAGGGTAESLGSSSVGIMGDLGLLGYLGVGWMLWSLWRLLRRSSSWLALGMQGAIVMLVVLSFVDNWLEYPEFTVPLALLMGLALRGDPTAVEAEGEAQPLRSGNS